MPRILIAPPEKGPGAPALAAPNAMARKILRRLALPTKRDRQTRIGPSGIGDPCEVCLAEKLAVGVPGAARPRPSRRALASWMGTAMHSYLELLFRTPEMRQLFPGWITEQQLYCGDIEGYGAIVGSADGYDPVTGTILDWKFLGANSFRRMKTQGLDVKYDYQRQIYGKGCQLLGLHIEYVMNIMFLAGSTAPDFRDVIIEVDHYRPKAAQVAFDRAGRIYNEYVLTGRMDELESDRDCFECSGIADLYF